MSTLQCYLWEGVAGAVPRSSIQGTEELERHQAPFAENILKSGSYFFRRVKKNSSFIRSMCC